MQQSLQSTSGAIASLSLQKCGERLDSAEARMDAIEKKTENLPLIETEVMFWRRLLGGGFWAFWKIAGLVTGSGIVGSLITKLIDSWTK